MLKRFIAAMLSGIMLLSLTGISVFAENHIYEDFSDAETIEDVESIVVIHNECPEKYTLTIENGALRFRKNVTGANPAPSDKKKFENRIVYSGETSARVWMFDFCEGTDGTDNVVYGQWFFTSGWRIWYNVGQGRIRFGSGNNIAQSTYTKGQWYSVMVTISEDYTKADAYIKPQNGTEWTKFSTDTTPSIVEGNVKYFDYVSMYENSYVNRKLDMSFDNIRFFNDINLTDEGFFLEGEAVEEIKYVSEGNLAAEGTILIEEAPTSEKNLTAVFVAYDKDGMMVDFKFDPSFKVQGGVNTFSSTINTEAYYENLDYVGYYLWDEDLQPFIDPLELN